MLAVLRQLNSSVRGGTLVNNTDPSITYTGAWSISSDRGLGDYLDDVRYTTANGAAVSGYDSLKRTRKKPNYYPGQARPKPSPGARPGRVYGICTDAISLTVRGLSRRWP